MDRYNNFGNQFTPRAGLIYLPEKNIALKALYERAFRAPSGTELYGQPILYYGNKDLKPQTIDIYELVYIQREKKWKASVAGFYSYWKNGIVLDKPEPGILPLGFTYFYINEGGI